MRRFACLLSVTLACGGGVAQVHGVTLRTPQPPLAVTFEGALAELELHERQNDWSPTSCASVADAFDAVALGGARETSREHVAVALFDAGVALQRCHKDADALERFTRALEQDPKLYVARANVAMRRYEAVGDHDGAIRELQQAVLDAKFQYVPALVDLAALQMKRAGVGDMDAAKANIERALAIDDSYMPAFNQMALYHLAQNHFELAALVASQAIQKNASYAPIHNTAGLAQLQLGKVNLAVQFFQQAMRLDPGLFEAPMNFGRVNLSFRGYEPAEEAFRHAIAIRPNDYDAHLGLALALRGRITDKNHAELIPAVHAELDACVKIAPSRPEAHYNAGILLQEFESRFASNPGATLQGAIAKYEAFKSRAAGKPEYDSTIKAANDRIDDANATREFIR